MFRQLTLPCFAKINWILKILGRRRDGYHELRTVYQTIDLSDQIAFEVCCEDTIELKVSGRAVAAGKDNLVYQAAHLLRKTMDRPVGVRVRLEKKIPVSAGLGGGASNAGTALLALNQLWNCGLSLSQLAGLGAQLGSDVPNFLWGGMTVGRGRGEDVLPWPDRIPEQRLLLLYPNLEISAREAYSLRAWGTWPDPEVLTTEDSDTRIIRFREALERGGDASTYLENDFEGPLFDRYPVLEEAARWLKDVGCDRVLLCGSGSTLLAVIEAGQLESIARRVLDRKLGEVFLCRTLSRQQCRRTLRTCGLELPQEP